MILWWLCVSWIIVLVTSFQPCQFRAGVSVKSTPFQVENPQLLQRWFQTDDGIAALLGAAETIKKEEDGLFRITVAGPAFPGIVVKSENLVRLEFNDFGEFPSLALRLVDSTPKATGPRFLVKIFLAAQENMDMRSLNTVTVRQLSKKLDGDGLCECQFESTCTLDMDMTLPKWVPSVKSVEKQGSKAFQALLDKDVGRLVERFRNEFEEWSLAMSEQLTPTSTGSAMKVK